MSRRGQIFLQIRKHVHQTHQGSDGRIEMPAAFEIVGDLLHRLMQLAQRFSVGGVGSAPPWPTLRVTKR